MKKNEALKKAINSARDRGGRFCVVMSSDEPAGGFETYPIAAVQDNDNWEIIATAWPDGGIDYSKLWRYARDQ